MPDNAPPPLPQNQLDWHAMLHDLEKAVEMMSDQLEMVKITMRRLVIAEPWLPPAPSLDAPDAPTPPAHPGFSGLLEPVRDEFAVPGPPVSLHSVDDIAARHAQDAAEAEEEAKREAVRREVESARASLMGGEAPPVAADAWQVVTPGMPAEVRAPEVDADRSPEEELRNVEEALAALNHEAPVAEAPSQRHEAPEYNSAPAPETYTPDQPALSTSEEAQREAVREAMKAARSEMAWGAKPTDEPAAAFEPSSSEAPPAEDEDTAREAVRRAVEAARSEMSLSGRLRENEVTPIVPKPYSKPVSARDSAPTLTIEDPEARVELARVYNLLKVLDVATNASLLNYTSRQVSVALRYDATLPSIEQMNQAVRETFARGSEATIDGVNLMIQLGAAGEQAA